jgi:hypothetical protein
VARLGFGPRAASSHQAASHGGVAAPADVA